jgi:hypothetical protein
MRLRPPWNSHWTAAVMLERNKLHKLPSFMLQKMNRPLSMRARPCRPA